MDDKNIYLDHKLFNLSENMFGSENFNLGSIKYVGESLLNLTDGKVYQCCGFFDKELALINDEQKVVFCKPKLEWNTGHNREKHYAHLELLEDLSAEKLLTKIIIEGIRILPRSNKKPAGIIFPYAVIGLRDANETITIYPDEATPNILEQQAKMMNDLSQALYPKIMEYVEKIKKEKIEEAVMNPKRLRMLREKQKLTLNELSVTTGISRNNIIKLEQSDENLKNAKGTTLIALAKALNCTLEDLLS